MNKFIQMGKNFIQDEEGLTIVEYVIGAALLVLAFVAAQPWGVLETKLENVINNIPE